jgi:hypothetical protein
MDSRLKRATIRGALIGLAAAASFASAATFNLFSPANGLLMGNPSTYVTTAATSGSVIPLWSGTCNSTTFLRGDGQCQAPPGGGGGTVSSVGLTMPSGFTVTGSPVTGSSVLAVTTTLSGVLKGTGSGITAAAASDVVALFSSCTGTQYLGADGNCHTAGTVSSIALADGSTSPIFTITGSPITGSGTLTETLNTQTTNKVLAAPNGSTGQPTFRALVGADIPAINLAASGAGGVTGLLPFANMALTSGNVISLWTGTCSSSTFLRGDGSCVSPGGGGTVTSVALTAPSVFTVGGSPITSSGTLAITFAGGQTANEFLASPNGTTGAVGLRSIVAADLPGSITSNTSGNAATATAAAGSPTQCSSGQYATGVTTLWAANCAQVAYSQLSGAPAAANPTASVGLTAVNGSASSYIRSDGAPALSQSISPTWTGSHFFTGATITAVGSPGVSLGNFGGAAPIVTWVSSTASANNRLWFAAVDGLGDWILETSDDAVATQRTAIQVGRSGAAVTSIALGNATDLPGIVLQGGVTITSPTGGNKGSGTLNAGGLYVNGVAVVTSAVVGSKNGGGVITGTPSSCSVNFNAGGVSSCNYNGVGNYTFTFTASYFASGASCTASAVSASAEYVTSSGYSVGGSNMGVILRNSSGTPVDGEVAITCIGS